MEGIHKIEGNLSDRYNLALYVNYHQQIMALWELLVSDSLTKMNLTEALVERYRELLQLLVDRNSRQRASVTTLTMDEWETERDNQASLLFLLVANKMKSTKTEIRQAAKELEIVLRPYKGLQSLADNAETSAIQGLLEDVRKEENLPHITTLGLETVLEDLEEANNAFEEAKVTRRKAHMEQAKEQSTSELRAELDELADDMFTIIYATALIGGEGKTLCMQHIDKINAINREFKTSWKQSVAQKEAHKPLKPITPEDNKADIGHQKLD